MNTTAAPKRSTFVTALAWTTIILAAFTTLISILQILVFFAMVPLDELQAGIQNAPLMPEPLKVLLAHARLVLASFFLMSVVTLVVSIGLLKRMNWARLVFIVIMAIGALGNLAGLALPFAMLGSLPAIPEDAEFEQQMALVIKVLVGFTVLISLASAVLCAWIVKKLMSADIRAEFTSP